LDHTARFGESYEYTAQRVKPISVDGPDGQKSLELAGEVSASVHVDVVDTFPPAVPQGLVAVLVPEEKTIDLSWQPDTEEDLAGYVVYRAESSGDWKRVSGAQLLTGPAYRDATVEAGHSFRYAVTAIDLTGHESKRSAEAQESVPNP
jgi:fibronectin type 3 domain-containing protein